MSVALWIRCCAVLAGVLFAARLDNQGFGFQSSEPAPGMAATDTSNAMELSVRSGLGGVWKIGFPTLHQLRLSSGAEPIECTAELHTSDGDGVQVIYRDESWRFNLAARSVGTLDIVAKHGRTGRPIRVVLKRPDGSTLLVKQLEGDELGQSIPATQPWVVGIGGPMRLDQAAIKSVRGALPDYSTSEILRSDQLPTIASVYEGVDLLVLSSSNKSLNESMDTSRTAAIRQWVIRGGQLLLSLGRESESLVKHDAIAELIPGKYAGVATDCEPSPMESLLNAQSQLAKLTCALVQLDSGRVDVNTVTGTRIKMPMIARWAHGMGSVQYLATEIDSPELSKWETRPAILKYFFKDQWEINELLNDRDIYQAYDDLSGQLNSTLDTFPNLTLGNLGQMAVIAGLFSLIIGPIDFFLISRTWRRPRWTWFTLLTTSIGAVLLIVGLTRAWKPELPSINSIELVDIDLQTKSIYGRGYAHLYGGKRGTFQIAAHQRSFADESKTNSAPLRVELDWFGQPGRGLGGFDSTVITDRGMPAYAISRQALAASELSITGALRRMEGVGLPAAGTKAFTACWAESIQVADEANALGTVSGKDDLLQGSFINPVDLDLLNGVLVFAGRAYPVPSRIRSGERVTISTSIPKDVSRRLQRRQFFAGQEQGTPWDPADTKSIDRLAELLSSHRSAGGAAYTGLNHRYLSELECSEIVKLERAILFAEVDEAHLKWSLQRNDTPIQTVGGEQRTFVRLVMPVKNNSKSTTATRELKATQAP